MLCSFFAEFYTHAFNNNCHVATFVFIQGNNFMDVKIFLYILVKRFFNFQKVYKIFLARKKPFQGNQSSGINNFAGTGKDGELKSAVLNEAETEKERELRVRLSYFTIN